MSYAFIIVVSVAITLKLLFLSFSLYFTLKNTKQQQINRTTKEHGKSLLISWKKIPSIFLPKSLYCPDLNNKNNNNKS